MRQILIKIVIFYSNILLLQCKSKLCSGFGSCNCYENKGKLSVKCVHVKSLGTKLSPIFRKYSNTKFRTVEVKKCGESVLKESIFRNTSIVKIKMRCPFNYVHPESLGRVRSLSILLMRTAKFRRVPHAIRVLQNLQILDLEWGELSRIENDFRNLSHLQTLNLARNKIRYIYKGAFHRNKDLNMVDLSYNQLNVLHPAIIRHNLNLREFFVQYNRLTSAGGFMIDTFLMEINLRGNRIRFLDNALGNYSYIETIDLGENSLLETTDTTFSKIVVPIEVMKMDACGLSTLPPGLLKPLKSLRRVDFSDNWLHSIPKRFFYNLKRLRTVSLVSNKLKHLNNVFKGNPNLQKVFASRNQIRKIGNAFKYTQSLQGLDLSYNHLKVISEEDFKQSASIKTLELAYNSIVEIAREAFVGMKKLTFLNLRSNFIYSLNDSLKNLKNLKSLDLGSNKLEKIDEFSFTYLNKLEELVLCRNRLKSVDGAFTNLLSLSTLDVHNNNLTILPRNSFPPVLALRVLITEANNWLCDCRLLWVRNLIKLNSVTNRGNPMKCHQPYRFLNAHVAKLPATSLTSWPYSCPLSCKCTCVAQNGDYFVKVDCSWRKLNKIPLLLPKKIGHLDLQDNFLMNSITLRVDTYPELRSVNLEGNRLNHLDIGQFGNLKTLQLARNNFTRFFSNPSENILSWTLSGNPWICDCKTVEFRKWLLSHRMKIPDVNETRCNSVPGREDVGNKAIILLSEAQLCPSLMNIYIVAIAALIIILCVATCCLVYYCYCYHIKAWFFAHGMTILKKEGNEDLGKRYDAFISAADEDSHQVENFIIPELEHKTPFYSLFEPRRNMPAEDVYEIEKLMEEVVKSKRIIVLISENYILNNILAEFFTRVFDTCVDGKLHQLIPIIVGNLSPLSSIDPRMRSTIQSPRCLRFGQRLFWEMLRFAMPLKDVENDENRECQEGDQCSTSQDLHSN